MAPAAEEAGHQLPHNHVALIVGKAEERLADGHEASGGLLGVEYKRQFSPRWGVGVVFEREAFGDQTNRHGILAFPVSYHLSDHWRLFGAPGVEFRKLGERDTELLRLGTGYELELGGHFTLAPEFQIDFLPGGDRVYVFGFAFGYGF